MRFEYPNVFWAFLLLAIPIVIHLFHFKRFKTLYFSSLIFVKQVEQETKSVKKLKHLLILISRLLAFSCLVFAFAKPYIPLQENVSTNHINAIYIDNSFSMTSIGTNGQLFEIAKQQARSIIEKMSDDESFYILSNNQSPLEQKKYNKKEAIERINQMSISPISKTFSETANWMQTQLDKEANAQLDRFIYLSDFQNDSIDASILLNRQTEVYPFQLIAHKSNNISIDSAWFTNPNFRLNATHELNVIVKNHGNDKIDNIALNLKTNQTQRDIFVSIRPNDTAHVTVNYADAAPGWIQGKLSLFDEGIIFDDDLYFSYHIKEHSNVYILNGEDFVPNVQAVYELEPYYHTKSDDYKSIQNESLQEANTIVLNGLNHFSSGLIEQLANKAKDGSSIVIFPGNSVAIQEINHLLTELKLPTFQKLNTQKFRITQVNTNDNFFKHTFTKNVKNISLPTVYKYFNLSNSANYNSLLSLENGNPIFVGSNQNNTFLLANSISKEASNFTSDPIFSTLLLRVGEMSGNQQPNYLTIGSKERFPIFQANPEESLKLSSEQYEFIPMKTFELGKSWISIRTADMGSLVAGNYRILEKEQEIGLISLNYNRSESSANYTPIQEIVKQLKENNFTSIHDNTLENATHLPLINTDNKKEYWKLLLILGLVFFTVEMLLIKFWK